MHNLHLAVIKADSPEEACDHVESRIEDWGNENNWRSICGCVSEDNEIHMGDQTARWVVDESYNIKKINEMVSLWLKPDGFLVNPRVARALMKKAVTTKKKLSTVEWRNIYHYANHMKEVAHIKKPNVLKDQIFEWQFDENGITQMDGEGDKQYVVFIDMHS